MIKINGNAQASEIKKSLNIHIAASPAATSRNYNKIKTKPLHDL